MKDESGEWKRCPIAKCELTYERVSLIDQVGCFSHSAIQQSGQQEYRITLEGNEKNRRQVEIEIHKNDYLTISFIGDINFASRWFGTADVMRDKLRSRPVHEQQASQDSNLNEQGVYWYLEGIKTLKELRDIISTHPKNNTTLTAEGIIALEMQLNFIIKCFPPLHPIPTDEQCRICEQAIRKDATGKVLEQLDDLRKYANGEYQEAECSDNEREMRIHLEYENRIWGIMKELRKGRQE